ncbi:MAG: hypothetical protein PUE12_00300 [Oscillospiraceae bacterium]|nr:hypothetical protein [Oscillospiraceae bacterium]
MSNELTVKDRAVKVDSEIQFWANQLNTAVYQIGKNLAIMKDEKLYEQLGYETFEDYCFEKYELKHSQAAKYLAVYNKLGETYLAEHSEAGIRKLYMLSQLSEEDRENVEGSPEDLTVNELKAEIERVKQEREGIQMQLFELQEKEKTAEEKMQEEIERKAEEKATEQTVAARKRIDELSQKLEELQKAYDKDRKDHAKLEERNVILGVDKEALETKVAQQEKKIKELESKPQDVATVEPSEEELNARAEKIAEAKIDEIKAIAQTERETAELQIEDLMSRLKEKEAEVENIRADFDKKLENIMAASENIKAEKAESTQVENVNDEIKMKILITNVVDASNKAIEAAQLTENPDMWIEKLRGVYEKMAEKLKGSAF